MASLRVTFLGPAASFSHQQAAINSFDKSASLFPSLSFADAFSAVQNNTADYAVIPFENSTNGSVVQTLDLLADRQGLYKDVTVCGEYFLTVHHCLVSGKLLSPTDFTSITKLYTHPQAWGQCELFLCRYFRGKERQDVSSTSKAADIVSKDTSGQTAAIASKLAAEHYGAFVLQENIEDEEDNTTRFLILRNIQLARSGDISANLSNVATSGSDTRKTLISFTIEHSSPGALADALSVFKTHGLNLTSINSRPSLLRPWQYIFFIECEHVSTAKDPSAIHDTLEELKKICTSYRDLGTWTDGLVSPDLA
ncbi:chorismate mutase/prephenate dehydratase [Talaromyces proteolyticus]|uniref:prephenate dehydratase n=1 Tax=Talaromyces proteolyticus TaxID=1131652 RepID=A0AAD4KWU2_9EURO|nr:chorismate mutase/prephenate dehydratase [Talaromyces proteolyticus]KAH8702627.1 chorismate mutase/prephenate dehydratase [Talaromyces proteolyticus]